MKYKDRPAPELLYLLAVNFVNMDALRKFQIGTEMKILEPFDVLSMTEFEAERKVFAEAYKSGRLEMLISKMYQGNDYAG